MELQILLREAWDIKGCHPPYEDKIKVKKVVSLFNQMTGSKLSSSMCQWGGVKNQINQYLKKIGHPAF